MRLILCGLGVRGRYWRQQLAQHPEWEIAAYVDIDETRVAAAQQEDKSTAPGFATLEQALEVDAEAVLLATPGMLHAGDAIMAVRNQRHVLIEKPFTHSMEDAVAVVEAAATAGYQVMVGQNYRRMPHLKTLERFVRQGTLGAPTGCTFQGHRHRSGEGTFQLSMRHPTLIEMTVHRFDNFRFVFGREAACVAAMGFNPPGSLYQSNANVHALIEMDGGPNIISVDTFMSSGNAEEWRIDFEEGVVVASGRTQAFQMQRLGTDGWEDVPQASVEPRDDLLTEFAACARDNRPARTSAAENLGTMAMVFAVAKSIDEGRFVRISELLPAGWKEPVDGVR